MKRICRCGMPGHIVEHHESEGARACPDCKSVWPEKLIDASTRGLLLGTFALSFSRVMRATFHPDGLRQESDSDHTVMLAMIAIELCPLGLDVGLVSQFAVVHDLLEAKTGDVNTFAINANARKLKAAREKDAMEELKEQWRVKAPRLLDLLEHYEKQNFPEARFVRYLDKAMPKITHTLNGGVTIARMGKNLDDMVDAHKAQLVKLQGEYPEFAGTETEQFLKELMQYAESAYRRKYPGLR